MNELKSKANEFWAREIWLSDIKKRVYINCSEPYFTTFKGKLFIGEYDRDTDGRSFFLDVIHKLREYTKEYKIPTSLERFQMEEE